MVLCMTDDMDIDTDQITDHPPDVDIDQYVPNSNFRIERMSESSIWVCAYTDEPGESDHHYDITVTEEGGIKITHREEESTTG